MRRRRLTRPPRAASTINLERSYFARIREMLRVMQQLTRELVIPALPSIVDEAGLTGERKDSWPDTVDKLFHGVRYAYYGTVTEQRVSMAAHDAAMATSAHSKRQLGKQVKVVLGLDPILSEPWLGPMAEAFTHDNVALISSIPERYFNEIEQSVTRGVRAGRRHEPMAREIQERYQVSEARARLIARDQVSKLNGDLNRARQQGLGIERYIWRTSGDERVRSSHEMLDGMYCRWDDPTVWSEDGKTWTARPETVPDVHPGGDFQCLIGDTKIEATHGTAKLYRRWYSGELTTLVTESGKSLTATPNHPVLTPSGWKAVSALDVGEHVFKVTDEVLGVASQDIDNLVPSIAQMFDALLHFVGPVRHRGVTTQFHGDGSNNEVDVISIDSQLPDELLASVSKESCELFLSNADKAFSDSSLSGFGEVFSVLKRLWLAPRGVVSGACKLLFFLASHGREPEPIGLRASSDFHAMLKQSLVYAASRHSVLDGQSQSACSCDIISHEGNLVNIFSVVWYLSMFYDVPPGADRLAEIVSVAPHTRGDIAEQHVGLGIQLDRVVNKSVCEYSGHVYNLHTLPGYYTANGLVVKNCRCSAEPVLDDILGDNDV